MTVTLAGELEQRLVRFLRVQLHDVPPTTPFDAVKVEQALAKALAAARGPEPPAP